MCKTINSTLKRINLYNTNIFGKLDIYSTIINEKNIGSVSVSFPEACWMKTKKEIYDFAFNLQEIMTENHKEKRKKSTKKDFIRVKNGYICPFGRFMRLVEVKKVKH